jgi:hypothetical protein
VSIIEGADIHRHTNDVISNELPDITSWNNDDIVSHKLNKILDVTG